MKSHPSLYNADATHVPTQGAGNPKTFVVSAAGVHDDHQTGGSDHRLYGLEIVSEVGAPGLLATFDNHDAAVVRHSQLLAGLDRGDDRVGPVPVVRSPAAIETRLSDHRHVRLQPRLPVLGLKRRLLVAVRIEEDGLWVCLARGGLHDCEDHVGALGLLQHLHATAGQSLRLDPLRQVRHGFVGQTVGFPVRIEGGRDVGNADVIYGWVVCIPINEGRTVWWKSLETKSNNFVGSIPARRT